MTDPTLRCLVYAPYSFSGRGPAESCAQLSAGMAAAGAQVEVHLGRLRTPVPGGVRTRAPLAALGSRLPWRYVDAPAQRLLAGQFHRALDRAEPSGTVAWCWPGTPPSVVEHARERGILTVREMINSPLAASGPLLDAAYARLGLPATHGITDAMIAEENAELTRYDAVFASNPEVEKALGALTTLPGRVLATTFGWNPARFAGSTPIARTTFRAVFVGRIGVRKGVPDLLAAWEAAAVDGELLLVGSVDPEIAGLVDRHVRAGGVRLFGYADDPGAVYAGSDLFVFPTLEEGGPQVTYEAAGCGLPVVTTPMGAARLVEDGRTGLVVAPGSPDELAAAIRSLALDEATRHTYAAAARAAASRFAYPAVGARRAAALAALVRDRLG